MAPKRLRLAFMRILLGAGSEIRLPRALASLILLLFMLRIKSVAFPCRKGGTLMKRALIGGLSVLAMIVGVTAANAQANINPNIYPVTPGAQGGSWEWHAGPGPNKRGNMCVTHVDSTRGYGYQKPCPAPTKAVAAPKYKRKKVVSR
jgi:hypothetical protein